MPSPKPCCKSPERGIIFDAQETPISFGCKRCEKPESMIPFAEWAARLPVGAVESTNLTAIGWDATQVLSIEFKNGTRYAFLGVDEIAFSAFKAAKGQYGEHLAKYIKGRYRYTKVPKLAPPA